MRTAEPHCACLILLDKEHAVRLRRNRRKERWEMRSLLERVKAPEHADLPSPVVIVTPPIPISIPTNRSRGLIHWFSVGFACACIAGAIALFAEMVDIRATEAAPPAAFGLLFRP
jgi:hypothetical protein